MTMKMFNYSFHGHVVVVPIASEEELRELMFRALSSARR